MRQGQQHKRMRGRGRKGPNPLSRSYESNGPDVKIRGTALQVAEKYLQLSRDAQAAGDRVHSENLLQHAEHYFRIVAAAQQQNPANQQQPSRDNDGDDDGENRGDGQGRQSNSRDNDQPAFGISDPQPYVNGNGHDRDGDGDGDSAKASSADKPSGEDSDEGESKPRPRRRRTTYRERNEEKAPKAQPASEQPEPVAASEE